MGKAFYFWIFFWFQLSHKHVEFWNWFCIFSSNGKNKLTGTPSLLFLDDLLSSLVSCYHLASIAFWFSLWPPSLAFLAAQWLTWGLFPSLTPVKSSAWKTFLGCECNGFSSLRKIQLSHYWANTVITQLLCRSCTFPALCNKVSANIFFSSHVLSAKGKYSEKV